MRAVPAAAVDLVAKWEGYRPDAYLCPAGVWTIGYGHTRNVRKGQIINNIQARDLLRADLGEAVKKIYDIIDRHVVDSLTENQFAALVSFVFNLGLQPGWTFVQQMNAGVLDDVPSQMQKFIYVGGRKLKGLVDRRADEAALWCRK